jgi:hypothetical protein
MNNSKEKDKELRNNLYFKELLNEIDAEIRRKRIHNTLIAIGVCGTLIIGALYALLMLI